MTDYDKVVEYELQIEDMLHAIQDRLEETKKMSTKDPFENGRQEAFEEVVDIIQTRYKMILEVLSED